jgi:site-specific recombinase XerD
MNGKNDYLTIQGFPKLEKRYWDENKQRINSTHPFQLKLNAILSAEITKLERYYIDELDKERIPTLQDIRAFYKNQKHRECFNDFVEANIRKYIKENELEHRTFQVYRTFMQHLKEFRPEIKFYELTRELIKDFNQFLIIQKKQKGASRKKYMDKFKVMYKQAAKANLVTYDGLLFSGLNIKVEVPKRVALTRDEIKAIRDIDLTSMPALEQTRDEFLFLCFSGLYYSDLRQLKSANLIESDKGLVISGYRSKNENHFITPVYKFPLSIEIINRYRYTTEDEYLFPNTISDQKFNMKLKDLAKAAGIAKNLTNKVARHSFTDLMISSGYERQFVSKMLGHIKEQTTQEYYDMNVNHMVNSKFSGEVIVL